MGKGNKCTLFVGEMTLPVVRVNWALEQIEYTDRCTTFCLKLPDS